MMPRRSSQNRNRTAFVFRRVSDHYLALTSLNLPVRAHYKAVESHCDSYYQRYTVEGKSVEEPSNRTGYALQQ